VDTVKKTRLQMKDTIAMYRHNSKVSDSESVSTLYTAMKTLSGYYSSYGATYPPP